MVRCAAPASARRQHAVAVAADASTAKHVGAGCSGQLQPWSSYRARSAVLAVPRRGAMPSVAFSSDNVGLLETLVVASS
uniref:Uncharacterized protein n=1 Tax=Oryza sativa subsp. japonica TaxID=39947 RepID=Q6ZFU5_ORYSJ|nr:hypothetical protein [Oryza sativa Japonica Group]